MPSASSAIRFPRAGELIVQSLPEETYAMIGAARVLLWKGTSVGRVVKAARGLFTAPEQVMVFEVEAEGGELLRVISERMTEPNWIWRLV